jgi:hypothetical protein
LVSKKRIKKTKSAPAVEPIVKPKLDESSIIKKVVDILLPEMNKSVSTNVGKSFEEMKTIFTNELQDIRKDMETPPPTETEMPVNEVGLTEPQVQQKAGLETLMPFIQMLTKPEPSSMGGNNGLMNMFMESMIRNSMANLTRNDGMQDLLMKATYKKILGEDPPANIMKTTNELMNPLNNYGDKAQAARDKAKL